MSRFSLNLTDTLAAVTLCKFPRVVFKAKDGVVTVHGSHSEGVVVRGRNNSKVASTKVAAVAEAAPEGALRLVMTTAVSTEGARVYRLDTAKETVHATAAKTA